MFGWLSRNDESRSTDIRTVMEERGKLVKVAQRLLPLLDRESSGFEVQSGVLELSEHLANIGGFCDQGTREWIEAAKRMMAAVIADPTPFSTMSYFLKLALPLIVGVEVDFNRRPFRAVSIDLKALSSRVGFSLQR